MRSSPRVVPHSAHFGDAQVDEVDEDERRGSRHLSPQIPPGGPITIRRCYQQQLRAIAWRRAQEVMSTAFDREKQSLTASLTEHMAAGLDPEAFFRSQQDDATNAGED